MEYCPKGSLKNFLIKYKNNLSQKPLLNLSLNIASAMDFLNSKDILHRDLRTENILVQEHDGKFVTKVVQQKFSYIPRLQILVYQPLSMKIIRLIRMQHIQFDGYHQVWIKTSSRIKINRSRHFWKIFF